MYPSKSLSLKLPQYPQIYEGTQVLAICDCLDGYLHLEKAQNHHNQLTALITDQRSEEERRGDAINKQGSKWSK